MALDAGTIVRPRWAMVSTYPPTPCGLATFTQALVTGLTGQGATVDVVRVVDEAPTSSPTGVVQHLVNGVMGAVVATAVTLNRYDAVVVQHEFGIYGGADGEELLAVLDRLHVPVVTVLHTVLAESTPHQRYVLEAVIAASDVVVTMTRTARDRAIGLYGADPALVHVIPHGAADALVVGTRPRPVHEGHRQEDRPAGVPLGASDLPAGRPVVLTWGLIGFGKGIEWGIEALSLLRELDPRPIYVVAGRTHPRVLEHEGERYRRELESLARDLGVEDDVVFVDRYLDAAQLHGLVRGADVVLLPYDSLEQVTSGVLSEAVAAGRPVVSSSFPHAVELLGDGTGLLVDRQAPAQIASAVQRVLTEPGLAGRLSRRAGAIAPALSWRAVAGLYLEIGRALFRGESARAVAGSDAVAADVVA